MKSTCSGAALLIFSWFLGLFSGLALASPSDPINLDDFNQLEIQILDEPYRFPPWNKENYSHIDRNRQPQAWVRAVFVYGWVNGFDAFDRRPRLKRRLTSP